MCACDAAACGGGGGGSGGGLLRKPTQIAKFGRRAAGRNDLHAANAGQQVPSTVMRRIAEPQHRRRTPHWSVSTLRAHVFVPWPNLPELFQAGTEHIQVGLVEHRNKRAGHLDHPVVGLGEATPQGSVAVSGLFPVRYLDLTAVQNRQPREGEGKKGWRGCVWRARGR